MIIWTLRHPEATVEMLGYLPDMLSETDPRPAREQLDSGYRHGGGWCPFAGFELQPDGSIVYPGDPPMPLLAETTLRDERIRFFDCAWVMILQPDDSFEICRMD